jgi:hypothetical protein
LFDFKNKTGLSPDAVFMVQPIDHASQAKYIFVMGAKAKMSDNRFGEADKKLKKYENAVVEEAETSSSRSTKTPLGTTIPTPLRRRCGPRITSRPNNLGL